MTRILVTGASGRTGRRVIEKLLARKHRIRAFVRRTEAAAELERLGVAECFIGSLEDQEALRRSMEKTDQILHICPPMHPEEDKIAANMVRLAAETGVRRFVLYSVLHPVIDVPHHRRKLRAEADLIDSGLPYVVLQPCRYMQHLNAVWPQVTASGQHVMPFSPEAPFTLVDLDDVAEVAARVVSEDGHDYATYPLAGPDRLTMNDCAEHLTRILGRPVKAVARSEAEVSAAAIASGMPSARIENMMIMNRHYTHHGLVGNPKVLEWLLGREPTRFETFVRRELLDPRQTTG